MSSNSTDRRGFNVHTYTKWRMLRTNLTKPAWIHPPPRCGPARRWWDGIVIAQMCLRLPTINRTAPTCADLDQFLNNIWDKQAFGGTGKMGAETEVLLLSEAVKPGPAPHIQTHAFTFSFRLDGWSNLTHRSYLRIWNWWLKPGKILRWQFFAN